MVEITIDGDNAVFEVEGRHKQASPKSNMKRFAIPCLIFLILSITAGDSVAQNRRRRSARASVNSSRNVENVDIETPEERARVIEECEATTGEKPDGEIKAVSQLCGRAISKPQPRYPAEAKEARVSGAVQIDIVIDEKGRVIWAKAVSGDPLLQDVSRKAACRARFSPTLISGIPIRTTTSITYNFVLQ
jgi:TonB family protein